MQVWEGEGVQGPWAHSWTALDTSAGILRQQEGANKGRLCKCGRVQGPWTHSETALDTAADCLGHTCGQPWTCFWTVLQTALDKSLASTRVTEYKGKRVQGWEGKRVHGWESRRVRGQKHQ